MLNHLWNPAASLAPPAHLHRREAPSKHGGTLLNLGQMRDCREAEACFLSSGGRASTQGRAGVGWAGATVQRPWTLKSAFLPPRLHPSPTPPPAGLSELDDLPRITALMSHTSQLRSRVTDNIQENQNFIPKKVACSAYVLILDLLFACCFCFVPWLQGNRNQIHNS